MAMNGPTEREAKLLETIERYKKQQANLAEQLVSARLEAKKAADDRDYFHKIANGLAKDKDDLEKKITGLKALTPAVTICDKSGQKVTKNIQAIVYHDNGIQFINVVEPSGWTTSYRIADMGWFEVRKAEMEV